MQVENTENTENTENVDINLSHSITTTQVEVDEQTKNMLDELSVMAGKLNLIDYKQTGKIEDYLSLLQAAKI
jgi:hypothetical protein